MGLDDSDEKTTVRVRNSTRRKIKALASEIDATYDTVVSKALGLMDEMAVRCSSKTARTVEIIKEKTGRSEEDIVDKAIDDYVEKIEDELEEEDKPSD